MFGDPASVFGQWPFVSLEEVTNISTGYAFRSEEYTNDFGSIKLCRGANVLPGRLDWQDLACWPHSKVGAVTGFHLIAGDVVIAMDRPWISEGFKIAQVKLEDCPALLVQRVARIRSKNSNSNDYIYHLLNHGAFTRHCRPTETTVPHISPKDIRSFQFRLPPKAHQDKFVSRIKTINHLKTMQQASLTQLDTLFASLQHRAFRGEL